MTEYDYLFKLILIGDPGVGKTSILYRYTEQTFGFSHFALIGVDFKTKTNEQDSKTTNLQIWDLAGQGRFRKIHPSFYRLTSGFLIVFALNNKQSFDHVRS